MYCTELDLQLVTSTLNRDRILGRNWDKSFPSCYYFPPLSKDGLQLDCNVNILYGNLKSENSQDYAQKPQQILYIHEFNFWKSMDTNKN
jgi:hypothetical protein